MNNFNSQSEVERTFNQTRAWSAVKLRRRIRGESLLPKVAGMLLSLIRTLCFGADHTKVQRELDRLRQILPKLANEELSGIISTIAAVFFEIEEKCWQSPISSVEAKMRTLLRAAVDAQSHLCGSANLLRTQARFTVTTMHDYVDPSYLVRAQERIYQYWKSTSSSEQCTDLTSADSVRFRFLLPDGWFEVYYRVNEQDDRYFLESKEEPDGEWLPVNDPAPPRLSVDGIVGQVTPRRSDNLYMVAQDIALYMAGERNLTRLRKETLLDALSKSITESTADDLISAVIESLSTLNETAEIRSEHRREVMQIIGLINTICDLLAEQGLFAEF